MRWVKGTVPNDHPQNSGTAECFAALYAAQLRDTTDGKASTFYGDYKNVIDDFNSNMSTWGDEKKMHGGLMRQASIENAAAKWKFEKVMTRHTVKCQLSGAILLVNSPVMQPQSLQPTAWETTCA